MKKWVFNREQIEQAVVDSIPGYYGKHFYTRLTIYADKLKEGKFDEAVFITVQDEEFVNDTAESDNQ